MLELLSKRARTTALACGVALLGAIPPALAQDAGSQPDTLSET